MSSELTHSRTFKISSFWASILQDQTKVRMLRFSVGVTIAMSLAFAINWPLAFLSPLFTTVFLSLPFPKPTLYMGFINMLRTLLAFAAAVVFTVIFHRLAFIYLPLLAVILFYIYYSLNRGWSFWFALMSLLAFLIMPMLVNLHSGLAVGFSLGFVYSGWVAILILYLAHFLAPDPQGAQAPPVKTANWDYSPVAAELALKSTLVAFPVVAVFITFELVNLMVVMIMTAVFTLSPQLSKGAEAAQNSIISTLIGGGVAFIFYFLIVAVPEIHFFVLLTALTTLSFSLFIFSGKPIAKYLPSALTTVILLVNAGLGEGADFIENFILRVFFISMAGVYVILALKMLEQHWPSKK